MTARSIGSRKRVGRQRPGVRPLHRGDPGVAAQDVRELPTTHVERDHVPGPALQQHVREAAGRGPDVEREASRRIDPERVERGGELVATTADVGLGGIDRDRRSRRDQVARLEVEAGGVTVADPHLSREHQRLAAGSRRHEAALDEQLVQADTLRGLGGPGALGGLGRPGALGRGRGRHPPIVPRPAALGVDRRAAISVIRPWVRRSGSISRRGPVRHAHAMTTRPLPLLLASTFTLVVAVGALLFGAFFVAVAAGAIGFFTTVGPTSPAGLVGIASIVFGVLAIVGAAGLWARRAWAWPLAASVHLIAFLGVLAAASTSPFGAHIVGGWRCPSAASRASPRRPRARRSGRSAGCPRLRRARTSEGDEQEVQADGAEGDHPAEMGLDAKPSCPPRWRQPVHGSPQPPGRVDRRLALRFGLRSRRHGSHR